MKKRTKIALMAAVGIVAALIAALMTGNFDGLLQQALAPSTTTSQGNTDVVANPVEPDTKPSDADVAERVIPVFDLVRVEPTGDAVIAGQGAPDSDVEILSGEGVIAKGKANETGEWAVVLDKPLPAGAHDIKVRSKSDDGIELVSEQSVAVSVPEGGAGEVLVVLNSPGVASEVLQIPGEDEVANAMAEAAKPAEESAAADDAASGDKAEEAEVANAAPAATETPATSDAPAAGETIVAAPEATPPAPDGTPGETIVAAAPAEQSTETAPVAETPAAETTTPAPAETDVASASPTDPPQPVDTQTADASASAEQPATAGEAATDQPAVVSAPSSGETAPDLPKENALALTAPAPTAEAPAASSTDAGEAASTAGDTAAAAGETNVPADATAEAQEGSSAAPAAGAAEVEVASAEPEQQKPRSPVSIEAVELENGKSFFAAGAAEAGAVLRLYVDDGLAEETKAMSSGRWLVDTTLALQPGPHRVRVDEVAVDGSVLSRAEVPFDILEELATAPLSVSGSGTASAGTGTSGEARVGDAQTLIIRRGDNLWRIARRLYGQGVRYSTIYQANTDQIVNPDLIFPGQVFILPQGDTNWQPVTQVD